MAKKRKRRKRIRWGRVITAVAVIALTVACPFVHPIDRIAALISSADSTPPQLLTEAPTTDSVLLHARRVDSLLCQPRHPLTELDGKGRKVKHRVISVPTFEGAFPDSNDVQLATATRLGLKHPIRNRAEAEKQKSQLVYIGDSPFYDLRLPMTQSIPYLVPRAERLLTEIARSFQDSLVSKGIPMHKIQVSSVLRTEEDVAQLRRINPNATEQSCHRFGTTFDITYNYYTRVQDPDGRQRPEEYAVQLKSVLAEVLRDLREQGCCYVKYEYKRPCFHITCR